MPDNPSGQLTGPSGIGVLRSRVTIWRRDQAPADDLAMTETFVPLMTVQADVQPAWASTVYQSTQVETPVTHMITIRWRSYPPTVEVLTRVVDRSPDGTCRGELFRIRRSLEIVGRKRFLRLECELERSRMLPDDSASTINALLTEPYDGAAAAPPEIMPV